MRLAHGRHLAFCPDVLSDASWEESFAALREQAEAVRDGLRRTGQEFGISLRLGDRAARELLMPRVLARFRRWLRDEDCVVLTVNDSPAGEAAGTDGWTRPERLARACRLLDLLGELLPEGLAGSITTTLEPPRAETALQAAYANFIQGAVHAAEVSGCTGRGLSFAVEPATFGPSGKTAEVIRFLEPLVEAFPDQFGVCLDLGHCAVGNEEVADALEGIVHAGIPVLKMRLDLAWSESAHGSNGDEGANVLAWLAANRSRCPQLEIEVGARESLEGCAAEGLVRAFDRTLDLMAAHGLV